MKLFIDTNIEEVDVEASLPLLSEQRREKVLSMGSREQQRQSVAAYLLLCQAVGVEKPVFQFDAHGKPTIVGRTDIHFSMSHTRGAVAVAIGDKPVGVDIERADRRISEGLIRHTMNEEEIARIRSSESPQREFMRLWTQKEALLKMTGEGIQGGLLTALTTDNSVVFEYHDSEEYICTVSRRKRIF